MSDKLDDSIFHLSDESQLPLICAKYDKSEQDLNDYLRILKEWYRQQQHLPEIPDNQINDRKFKLFLIQCKFRVEKCKKVIDNYFTVRNLEPQEFSNWDPFLPELQKGYKPMAVIMLPKLNEDFECVYLTNNQDTNTENFDMATLSKILYMHFELCLVYNCGYHTIYDLRNVKLGHIMKFTPAASIKTLDILKNCYSSRIRGIHFLYANKYINVIVALARTVLPAKLYGRIYVHDNLESLHKIIPKEIFPKDYGGNEKPFAELHDMAIKKFENARSYLMEQVRYRSDETKCLNPETKQSIIESMHGTFRKLDVD